MEAESEEPESSCGGSGQGGRDGCASHFKVGGSSEQGGVLGACDCAMASEVAKASAKTARAPARPSQLAWQRGHSFTESPYFESSTIGRIGHRTQCFSEVWERRVGCCWNVCTSSNASWVYRRLGTKKTDSPCSAARRAENGAGTA